MFKTTWSHWDTTKSVRLLWTRDRLIAETSIWQHTTFKQADIRGFKPAVSACEWRQTDALDRDATGMVMDIYVSLKWKTAVRLNQLRLILEGIRLHICETVICSRSTAHFHDYGWINMENLWREIKSDSRNRPIHIGNCLSATLSAQNITQILLTF